MDSKLRNLERQDDKTVEWAYAALRLLNKSNLRWLTVLQPYGAGPSGGDKVAGHFCLKGGRTLGDTLDVLILTYEVVQANNPPAPGDNFTAYVPSIKSFACIWCGARSRSDLAAELIGECGNFITLKSVKVASQTGYEIVKE